MGMIRRSKASGHGREELLAMYIQHCDSWTHVKQDLLETTKDTLLIVKEVIEYEDFGAMKYKAAEHAGFAAILQKGDVEHLSGLKDIPGQIIKLLPDSDAK